MNLAQLYSDPDHQANESSPEYRHLRIGSTHHHLGSFPSTYVERPILRTFTLHRGCIALSDWLRPEVRNIPSVLQTKPSLLAFHNCPSMPLGRQAIFLQGFDFLTRVAGSPGLSPELRLCLPLSDLAYYYSSPTPIPHDLLPERLIRMATHRDRCTTP